MDELVIMGSHWQVLSKRTPKKEVAELERFWRLMMSWMHIMFAFS